MTKKADKKSEPEKTEKKSEPEKVDKKSEPEKTEKKQSKSEPEKTEQEQPQESPQKLSSAVEFANISEQERAEQPYRSRGVAPWEWFNKLRGGE